MNIVKTDFLGTALASLAASTTAVNGTDFTSTNVKCMEVGGEGVGAIMITFTRAAGDGGDVEFQFQGSWDDGDTWTTVYFVRVYEASDAEAVSNAVRKVEQVNLYGLTHLRLFQIVNGDAANALTALNASLLVRKK